MVLTFRGRIFNAGDGYAPRSLLELHLRQAIGAILNKPNWWTKWRRGNGDLRTKWLLEIDEELIDRTVYWSRARWDLWRFGEVVVKRFQELQNLSDANGPSMKLEEKRRLLDQICSTIEYNAIWNTDRGKRLYQSEKVETCNGQMESYGMIIWYFALVMLNKIARKMPPDNWTPPDHLNVQNEQLMFKVQNFLLQVRRGKVTRDNFDEVYGHEADVRTHIVDALWVHVDRIMAELDAIHQCIDATLAQLINDHGLDGESDVKEFISPGPVQETWMSDMLVPVELKNKFVGEVAVLENVPEEEKDWHPGSNNQVLDLVHPSLYCCVFGRTKQVDPSEADECMRCTLEGFVRHTARIMFSGTTPVNRYVVVAPMTSSGFPRISKSMQTVK